MLSAENDTKKGISVACPVLHNIAIILNEPEPEDVKKDPNDATLFLA